MCGGGTEVGSYPGARGDEVVNLVVMPARVREGGEGAIWSRDVRMVPILHHAKSPSARPRL
jgi:hypothetical protein